MSLPEPVKIFLCVTPADMRKSFDGLANSCGNGCKAIRSPDTCSCFGIGVAIA